MPRDPRPFLVLDLGMPENPKVEDLSDRAFRLLVELWCWSRRNLTDGFVTEARTLKRGKRARDELATPIAPDRAPLLEHVDGRWLLHDFLEHQQSRAEVEEGRADKSEAGGRGNHVRHHVQRGKPSQDCRWCIAEPIAEPSQVRSQTDRRTVAEKEEEEELQPPPTSEVAARATKPKRAIRLPEDYALTEVMIRWAESETPSVDPVREFDRFRDYWRSARDGAKRDWDATWRNWMRKAEENGGGAAGRGARPGGPRPSTTDQRVADAQALKAQLRPEVSQLAIGAP